MSLLDVAGGGLGATRRAPEVIGALDERDGPRGGGRDGRRDRQTEVPPWQTNQARNPAGRNLPRRPAHDSLFTDKDRAAARDRLHPLTLEQEDEMLARMRREYREVLGLNAR